MATKKIMFSGLGEVTLSKRKGARYIRLSVNSNGKIRVGMPYWTPYAAGINFVKKRSDWIRQQQSVRPEVRLENLTRVGKGHRLYFKPGKPGKPISTRVTATDVLIYTDMDTNSPWVQQKIAGACEKALLAESKILLPQRLHKMAQSHGLDYKDIKIRKLISRWGSCSSAGVITLSYYLIQLPWHLIDYVLAHELAHTKQLNHSRQFWKELERIVPNGRKLQKEIKRFNPRVEVS